MSQQNSCRSCLLSKCQTVRTDNEKPNSKRKVSKVCLEVMNFDVRRLNEEYWTFWTHNREAATQWMNLRTVYDKPS